MHDSIHFCWPRWPHQSPTHSFTLSTSFAERCLTLLPRNGVSCNEAHWDVVLFIHLSDLIALFPPLPSHLPVRLIYPVYFFPPPLFFMLSFLSQRPCTSCNRPSKQWSSSSKSTHQTVNLQHIFSYWEPRSLHHVHCCMKNTLRSLKHFYFLFNLFINTENLLVLDSLKVLGARFVWTNMCFLSLA